MFDFKQYPKITLIEIPSTLRLSNTNFNDKFSSMPNLTTIIGVSEYTTNLSNAYRDCYNLIESPVCGSNVTDMAFTYHNCYNLTRSPVCGPNVTDMHYTDRKSVV